MMVPKPAAVATIRFRRGAVASYRGSWISRGPTTPYGGHWRIDGTGGTVEFRFRGALAERETQDRVVIHLPGQPPSLAELPDLSLKDRKGALHAFARWVEGDEEVEGLSTGADNLRSLALMLAAVRSAGDNGRAVPVEELLEGVPT